MDTVYRTGKKQAESKLRKRGLGRAWELYCEERLKTDSDWNREYKVLVSIVRSLVQHGIISDKQVVYLGSLAGVIDNWEEVMAQRQADLDAAPPIPDDGKRHIIVGMVLKELGQWWYGQYFGSNKMAIKTEAGNIICGTIPDALGSVSHGDLISFTAEYQREKGEEKFGWFKYPASARWLGRQGQSEKERQAIEKAWEKKKEKAVERAKKQRKAWAKKEKTRRRKDKAERKTKEAKAKKIRTQRNCSACQYRIQCYDLSFCEVNAQAKAAKEAREETMRKIEEERIKEEQRAQRQRELEERLAKPFVITWG